MHEYIDDFATEIPDEALKILYSLGREFSFDPLSSVESEKYFIKLLKGFDGSDLTEWLRNAVRKDFLFIEKKPAWIQGSEWQFSDGKPMMFVGQINLPPQKKVFHDDAAFYVFWNQDTGETVIQIA